jgi:hypothetical protein
MLRKLNKNLQRNKKAQQHLIAEITIFSVACYVLEQTINEGLKFYPEVIEMLNEQKEQQQELQRLTQLINKQEISE